jgi:hypothetical protein
MSSLISICLSIAFLSTAIGAYPQFGSFGPFGPWSKRVLFYYYALTYNYLFIQGPPCVQPPFVDKLPEDAKIKVIAIWANINETDDCDSEHEQTREIIRKLPEDVRERLFARKFRCGPAFLYNVSRVVRKEFKKIYFDRKLELESKKVAFKKLAYSMLNAEQLKEFAKWEKSLDERVRSYQQKLSALSDDAKKALEKWETIKDQELDLIDSLPSSIKDELRTIWSHYFGHCPRKFGDDQQAIDANIGYDGEEGVESNE